MSYFLTVTYLFLYCEFDFDPLGVWLCPHKPCVHKVNLIQPFESLQTDGQQFSRLEATRHPAGGRLKVPGSMEGRVN